MLIGLLGASLLGNILTGRGINRAGEGIVRAGYGHRSLNSSRMKKVKKTIQWIFNVTSSFN